MLSNSMHIINFNRKQLPQRDRFVNKLGSCNTRKKVEYNLPKATTKQLKEIAKSIKEERKIRMIKLVILTTLLFIGLLCVWIYMAEGMVQFVTY